MSLFLAAGGALLAVAQPAAACPFCGPGPAGRNDVHDAIFESGFWLNIMTAALPFAVTAAVAAFIHGPRSRPGAAPAEGGTDARTD
jgi:hypothetical protein